MKRIVFCDVDGTLLNSSHQMTLRTQEAIQKLKQRNTGFVIVSARSPSGIYPILKENDFQCPIIAYSGALLLDENRQVLFHKGMKKNVAKQIIQFAEEEQLDMSWCAYSLDEWIVRDKADERIRKEEQIVKAEARKGTIDTIVDAEINKILCICNPAALLSIEHQLREKFPFLSIAKSSDYLLEIMEKGITKAGAIKKVCCLWNIPLQNTVAFGDNYNDVEMLETVGTGFLMDNAPEELKKRFYRRTKDNDHDGIYYGLRELGWI